MSRIAFRERRHHFSWLLIGAALVVLVCGTPLQAAPKYGNSLDWAPADVAFYSSSLRLREQVELIGNSNAWAKLTGLPSVQMAWQFLQMTFNRPGGPGDTVQQFFAEPENQQLWDLVMDGLSNEIAAYGDRSAADFIDVAQRAMNALRFSSMAGDATSESPDDRQLAAERAALNALDAQRDRLSAPSIVVAFKLTDVSRAKDQLVRLEKVLQAELEDEPKLKDRLKHASEGGVDYLVLELDGSLVPWDQAPWEKLEQKPGQFDQLKAKLQVMKLVVCAGVRGDYLILSVGRSLDHLAQLGTGKLLADLPELQPLQKFAEKPLTGITFASEALLQAVSSTDVQLEQALATLRQVLPQARLPEEMDQQILSDATELAGDLKAVLPQPGTFLAFSFLNDHGIEGYRYDWSKKSELDASKPLSLLDHLGGNPLLAVVSRGTYSPQNYELLRKWVRKGFGYFETLAVAKMSLGDRKLFEKIRDVATPLVQRLDQATGQMLLPGFADGQSALVIDAKLTSKQWFENLPQNNKLLPMLEPALVFGVSDAELVKKAFAEYQAVAEESVEQIKQLQPGAIPPSFVIPLPEVRDSKSGLVVTYKLPKDWGVDPQLAPGGGLGSKVAVLSMAPAHTSQLLADAALNASPTGPLADRSRSLAVAFYFNWAATVEAITPWIDLTARTLAAESAGAAGVGMFLTDDALRPELQPSDEDPNAKFVLDQVHTALDVLKALRTVESATYRENGVMVTHSVIEFRDVP